MTSTKRGAWREQELEIRVRFFIAKDAFGYGDETSEVDQRRSAFANGRLENIFASPAASAKMRRPLCLGVRRGRASASGRYEFRRQS